MSTVSNKNWTRKSSRSRPTLILSSTLLREKEKQLSMTDQQHKMGSDHTDLEGRFPNNVKGNTTKSVFFSQLHRRVSQLPTMHRSLPSNQPRLRHLFCVYFLSSLIPFVVVLFLFSVESSGTVGLGGNAMWTGRFAGKQFGNRFSLGFSRGLYLRRPRRTEREMSYSACCPSVCDTSDNFPSLMII